MFSLAELSAKDAANAHEYGAPDEAREREVFAEGVHWVIEQIEQWLNRTVH